MFRKIAYHWKFNSSLNRLGVNPGIVPQLARMSSSKLGMLLGLTAEEMAIVMVEFIPDDQWDVPGKAIKDLVKATWKNQGRYRPDRVEAARKAMDSLSAEYDAALRGRTRT